jgi:acylpyruvate hydrolase
MTSFPEVLEFQPSKIICVGMNYPSNQADWQPPEYPVLFQKPVSGLIGAGEPIQLPVISKKVLYEGELALVIGSLARNVHLSDAYDCIAGLTIANDITAADIEARTSQWASGKMFDTFSPIGPVLTPIEYYENLGNMEIRTTLNGQEVQTGNTGEMIFDIRFLISYISTLTSLLPGDLIFTGSPKGCNRENDPRIPMRAGDRIEVEIEGIGVLENPIVDAED